MNITALVTSHRSVLLATAQVIAITEKGHSVHARVLIDQGSEISLISENLAQTLQLNRQKSHLTIVGIGTQANSRSKGVVELTLKPYFKSEATCKLVAHILPKLTSTLPSAPIHSTSWEHLKGLQLADPHFSEPGPIDIILGADAYAQIIESDLIKGDKNSPIAQLTILGWIISGPSCAVRTSNVAQGFHFSVDQELCNIMENFWELEDLPQVNSPLTPDEQACEEHFLTTHSRSPSGKYIVRLPFKSPRQFLGHSKSIAFRTLERLTNRFTSNPQLYEAYSKFLEEYNSLGHMKKVSPTDPEPLQVFYLPHHGVLRESSLTTKLRVVFNGSSKSSNRLSLNDTLYTGAKLQTDLIDVINWFRIHQFVFVADIEKMYRQINVHPDDWPFQRILWKDPNGEIQVYELTTVTYGLACAPFQALRALNQLVVDEGERFPLAVPSLTKGRYVDDVFGGADSIEQAQQMVEQVNQLCLAGGFPLQK